MTDQFSQLLSAIKNIDRRLTRLETYNQVRTIKDADGNTIIDPLGLVSTVNFTSQNVAVSASQIVTSSSYVDVTGSTLTFTLERSALILVLMSFDGYLTESVGNTTNGDVTLFIDGSAKNGMILHSGTNQARTYSSFRFDSLDAGSHTLKLRTKISPFGGSPSMTIMQSILAFVVFGK